MHKLCDIHAAKPRQASSAGKGPAALLHCCLPAPPVFDSVRLMASSKSRLSSICENSKSSCPSWPRAWLMSPCVSAGGQAGKEARQARSGGSQPTPRWTSRLANHGKAEAQAAGAASRRCGARPCRPPTHPPVLRLTLSSFKMNSLSSPAAALRFLGGEEGRGGAPAAPAPPPAVPATRGLPARAARSTPMSAGRTRSSLNALAASAGACVKQQQTEYCKSWPGRLDSSCTAQLGIPRRPPPPLLHATHPSL